MASLLDIVAGNFGYIGLAVLVVSWQMETKQEILFFNSIAFVLFAVELFWKGANVGGVMILFASVNCLIAMRWRSKLPSKYFLIVFVIIQLVPGAIIIRNLVDVLPIAAHISGSIAFFSSTIRKMRLIAPAGTVLWAIHNFIVGAPGQFIADIFILLSMAIGAYRRSDR